MFLNNTNFHYVHICKTSKDIWDALKLIYGDSPSIKQEKINTQGKEDNHGCFYNYTSIGKFSENYVANKKFRITSLKFNATLKSIDMSLREFQEKNQE